jgi:hypothetical protein
MLAALVDLGTRKIREGRFSLGIRQFALGYAWQNIDQESRSPRERAFPLRVVVHLAVPTIRWTGIFIDKIASPTYTMTNTASREN